jgi:O-antigen/teichoic acid export membrane protein
VGLSVAAGALNIVANIALFPLVVSTIGAAQYGIWLFILALCLYFFYSDLGIGSAIVYFGSRSRAGDQNLTFDQLISNGVAWVSSILVIALPGFAIIAYQYAESHALASGLTHSQVIGVVAVGGLVVVSILIRPYESVLIGSGRLVLDRVNQIAGTAIRTILVVILCITDAGVTAIAAGEAAGLCLPPILAAIYVIRKGIARVRLGEISRSHLRGVFRYSLKSFAVDVVTVGALHAGTIMVGLIRGPAPAAYFALAMRVFNGAGQVITWGTMPVLPVFSQMWQTDRTLSRSLVRDLLTLVATIGCMCVVPIALSAVIWLPYWVADAGLALGVTACVIIVLVALLSTTILQPIVLTCNSFGRPGVIFPAQATSAVMFVIIGVPLTYYHGIAGTAVGLAIAMWIVQPFCLYILARTLNMRFWSEVASCYQLPSIVLVAGGTLAAFGEFVAIELGSTGGWFTPVGFLAGASAALLLLPVGRQAVHAGRRLLELPM